ncbi:unnamed protein product [Arabidopsis halleri]
MPEPTSHTTNGLANGLNLQSFLQIQLPEEEGFKSQKFMRPIKLILTQDTQREPAAVNKSQINFSARTLFQEVSLFRPKPPHSLAVQTISQENLAPLTELGAPFHKKALHICSNLSKH